MSSASSPVTDIPGVGPSTAAKLWRLGIATLIDLVSHFPIRHDDFRRVTSVAALATGRPSVLKGRLQLLTSRRGFRRRRMSITEGLFEDGTGTVRAVWFNQPYLSKQFKAGDGVFLVGTLVNGKYGPQLQSPLIEGIDAGRVAGRIVPVYRATSGLTQRQIRTFVDRALHIAAQVPDIIPDPVRTKERLMPLARALREIHAPTSMQGLSAARERLAFGELLPFILSAIRSDRLRQREQAPAVSLDSETLKKFTAALPFALTDDQRRAAWEILNDLARNRPMYRLLEGDVGSGKTVVAALALLNVARHGMQAAMLAPTDLLARQHYKTLAATIGTHVPVALLTASQHEWTLSDTPTKKRILTALSKNEVAVIIGTHAILAHAVALSSLALVVVDEQHRFGVEQRKTLRRKGVNAYPHLLSMTATPIPRTLALTLYGNLKLSVLKHKPVGRVPIRTELIAPEKEDRAFSLIRQRVGNGEQGYVICPLIEESDAIGAASATSEYERLKEGPLEGLRVGLLHGGLPTKEKQRVLDGFRAGTCDVLVSTPVVEVGVDVPNATVMLIEGAERFGLAQLHQLRGRIGRGTAPSTCLVMSDDRRPETLRRLEALVNISDGFELAEADLRHRGPGDLYGIRQSGLPEFRIASLTDITLMQRIRNVAESIIARDPSLGSYPLLKKRVDAMARNVHFE